MPYAIRAIKRYEQVLRIQCCGSGMFIPDPTFFHPGSRIRTVSIPDPGSSSKNLSILTPKKAKKWFLSAIKYDPDPDADFLPSRIPDPWVKKAPNPGSGSATLCGSMTFWCGSGSADPCLRLMDPDPDIFVINLSEGTFLSLSGSGSCYFHHWPSRCQPKTNIYIIFSACSGSIPLTSGCGSARPKSTWIWWLRIRIRNTVSKIKSQKEVQNTDTGTAYANLGQSNWTDLQWLHTQILGKVTGSLPPPSSSDCEELLLSSAPPCTP